MAYNASKAALINLTKSLSKAFGSEGTLVDAVSPAVVMTPLVEGMIAEEAEKRGIPTKEAEEAFLEENRPNIVGDRAGTSEETAAVVAFLTSEGVVRDRVQLYGQRWLGNQHKLASIS